jgi:hypothetical protein
MGKHLKNNYKNNIQIPYIHLNNEPVQYLDFCNEIKLLASKA